MMDNDVLIGKQLGAYQIQAKLGEGGMARVYKAYHARLRRDVAIKVILPQAADKPGFKERFEQEAQVVARLEHHNIVAVYDFGESGNLTYLVMQYVGGGTLRDQLRGQRPLELRRAAAYGQQMARALHHAHQRGIVHRDVKPQNMLVSSSDPGELLLSDFGIAKLFDMQETTLPMIGSSASPMLTNVGQMIGTPDYMAPEQINRQPVDARTDVYALGVVLFQMLTGRVPFLASSEIGLLYQHVHTPAPDVRELNPQVPDMLAQITARALAKVPQARFQTAEEMARALEPFTASTPYGAAARPPFDSNATISPLAGPTLPTPSNAGAMHYAPAAQPPSYYGSQPRQQLQTPLAQSFPSRQSITDPITGSKLTSARALHPGAFIFSILLVLLVIGGLLWQTHPSWLPFGSGNQSTGSTFQPFTENFQNNDRNWTSGTLNGLTASVGNNRYSLSVSDGNTYFPHPDTGNLPTNFTYTVNIEQNSGATSIFYGLAFHLKENGNAVYCYAFVIDAKGDYQVLKYGVNTSTSYATLTQGTMSAIHGQGQFNTLKVVVQGSHFSFTVNGTAVTPSTSDADYTGGQPALMVAGPQASFTVTSAQLSSP